MFCFSGNGTLYGCSKEEWAHQRALTGNTPTTSSPTEVLPSPAASSHDQNVEVVTGYHNLDFHMGTVSFAIGGTLVILLVLLCCYCGYRKLTGLFGLSPHRVTPPHLPPPNGGPIYAQPHRGATRASQGHDRAP